MIFIIRKASLSNFVLKPIGGIEQDSPTCRKVVWLAIFRTKQGGESVHGDECAAWHEKSELN